ncbi:unnamed protein product [Gongylonema pulchrum]|uniref:2-Hacid_dh domain-containing protein n=1 Tax=Gongylonema pulchrum TaxID=637853 RepID=A0A183DKC9_9BILA|nr:unnamed protein product [Gongylonema pulchrum]
MKITRLIRQSNALTVLVTACDLNVTRLSDKFNVIQWAESGTMPKKMLIEEVAAAHGLLCLLHDKIDAEVLSASNNLRVISTLSAGYDHIDLEECKKR